MKPRGLQCACCGSYAGRFLQFNNQDGGCGICRPCVLWVQEKRLHHATSPPPTAPRRQLQPRAME